MSTDKNTLAEIKAVQAIARTLKPELVAKWLRAVLIAPDKETAQKEILDSARLDLSDDFSLVNALSGLLGIPDLLQNPSKRLEWHANYAPYFYEVMPAESILSAISQQENPEIMFEKLYNKAGHYGDVTMLKAIDEFIKTHEYQIFDDSRMAALAGAILNNQNDAIKYLLSDENEHNAKLKARADEMMRDGITLNRDYKNTPHVAPEEVARRINMALADPKEKEKEQIVGIEFTLSALGHKAELNGVLDDNEIATIRQALEIPKNSPLPPHNELLMKLSEKANGQTR